MEGMYREMARTILTYSDRLKVREEVRRLRLRNPDLTDDELTEKLIRKTAWRCAAVGAVASAATGFLLVAPLAADFSYQVLALRRLLLAIGAIWERPATRGESGPGPAASLAVEGAAELLRRAAVRIARRALRRRAAACLAPILAGLLGAAANYASVRAVGHMAQRFYRGTSGPPRRSVRVR